MHSPIRTLPVEPDFNQGLPANRLPLHLTRIDFPFPDTDKRGAVEVSVPAALVDLRIRDRSFCVVHGQHDDRAADTRPERGLGVFDGVSAPRAGIDFTTGYFAWQRHSRIRIGVDGEFLLPEKRGFR